MLKKFGIWSASVTYALRTQVRTTILGIALLAAIVRLLAAIHAWQIGNYAEIQSYVFCVIFPLALLALLAFMGATQTIEGMLMRFGSMLQLLLILCIPPYSLHLALGFPVVFLVVEIFSTHLPKEISQPIERTIIV